MRFTARFRYTHELVHDLGRIERARGVVQCLPLPPDQGLLLRHRARFRSMMSSTAIEGNTLSEHESLRALVRPDTRLADMQQERRNYWRALEWIEKQADLRRAIDENFIRELHGIIDVRPVGRRGKLSAYRTAECPVVDSATGAIDYGPPRPADVPGLMIDLAEWLHSQAAAVLPVAVRAGLLAHRFVSIHPFSDGNGRTTRALATAELWRSGYDMRGFLSIEEFFEGDRARYYRSLQLGLPVDFYAGRHDPDHTAWLEYFVSMMARAADTLRETAERLHAAARPPKAPWEPLGRQQQQVLNRVLLRVLTDEPEPNRIRPQELSEWFGVSPNTARDWLKSWVDPGFVAPLTPGAERVRRYRLADTWWNLIVHAADSTRLSTSETPPAK